MKTIFKLSYKVSLIGLISLVVYACGSVPKLSKEDKSIIKKIVKAPIPEAIHGDTGFANSQGHNIWFENIAPKGKSKGVVILIMGNGNDALTWPPSLISNLTKASYQVIRYDHRATGLSTSAEKWKKKSAYSLNDMALDVIAILDTLKIEQAHIVGASMGGMIAQIVAIDYPNRTTSLTSIMSTGDPMDPLLPNMSNDIVSQMIGAILKNGFFGSKKGQIKRQIIQKRILMGNATGAIDIKTMAETSLYNLKKRNGYNLMAARHHYQAILNSNSRLIQLHDINTPTLVVHGMQDPVIPFLHSEKLLEIIPDAEGLLIQNMGHDFPEAAIEQITDKMIANFERSLKYLKQS